MAQYDFTLAANGGQTLDVSGTYFTYKGGLGPIRVTPSSGEPMDLMPGQGMSDIKFDRLTVKDLSGAANNGVLLAGAGAWRDDRITGTVEVLDGGRNTTLARKAFMLAGGVLGAAAQNGAWGLWNPEASGKRLIISAYAAGASVSGAVSVRNTVVALAQNNGNLGAPKIIGGGAAAPVAEYRQESLVDGVRRAGESDYDYSFIQANSTLLRNFKEPLIVLPGAGLHMLFQTQAAILNGTFEWVEEPI